MLKRILLSIVLLLVIAYLVVALSAFNRKPAGPNQTKLYVSMKKEQSIHVLCQIVP